MPKKTRSRRRQYMTLDEAAQQLNVTANTVTTYIKKGLIDPNDVTKDTTPTGKRPKTLVASSALRGFKKPQRGRPHKGQ